MIVVNLLNMVSHSKLNTLTQKLNDFKVSSRFIDVYIDKTAKIIGNQSKLVFHCPL